MGTVFCMSCGSRLCIQKTGRYLYLFCVGRARRQGCRQPYLPLEAVEAAVEDYYRFVQLDSTTARKARQALLDELDGRRTTSDRERRRQERRLVRLGEERRKLLQAHYADAVPLELLN